MSASPKDQSGIFGDRGDARLILDLESAISDSPNFNLNQFKTSLESKDMYGNEQVSKQHVIQAANHAKLSVNKDVLKRWLSACDPIHRGIYRIPKLISFLERSQPNVIARMKSGKDLSKSHGNLSCKHFHHILWVLVQSIFPSVYLVFENHLKKFHFLCRW